MAGKQKLTGKMKRFADEYIICLNGTEAARRAKYSGTDSVLAVTASKLLRNGKVLKYIDSHLDQYAMSAAEVLARLSDIARADIGDAINSFGAVDPQEAILRGKSHLIKRVKIKHTLIHDNNGDADKEIEETELEMHSSLDALKLLAKYHNLVNRVIVEDWHNEAIDLIRRGELEYKPLAEELGRDLARELFESAGVPVLNAGQDTQG